MLKGSAENWGPKPFSGSQLNYGNTGKWKKISFTKKARTRWLKEGDSNTSYFHACIKGRRRQNHITALKGADDWIEDFNDIKRRCLCSSKMLLPNLLILAQFWMTFCLINDSLMMKLKKPFGVAKEIKD
ncbi:hypothetical protein CR513_39270, partial [Mucuna pruriens]